MAGNGGNEGKRWEGPLVSVIMPAYGCRRTIEQAIRSVLEQEVPLELIIVDDCSPDQLNEVVDKYRGTPPVLRYVRNSENLGASGSRNRGVAMAKGRYVAFLDADDWWARGKLKKQVELMEQTQAVLCSTGRRLVKPDGSDAGRYIGVPEKISYRRMLRQNLINCSSVLMLKEIALEFPMQHEDSHEDYITWLRVLKKYGTAVGIDEPLLYYRLTDSGKSGSKLHSAAMTFKVYRYMGFGPFRSTYYFFWYAIHGLLKYFA